MASPISVVCSTIHLAPSTVSWNSHSQYTVGAAGVRTSYSRELAWMFSDVPGDSGASSANTALQASYPLPGMI